MSLRIIFFSLSVICLSFSCKKSDEIPSTQELLDSGKSIGQILDLKPADSLYGKLAQGGMIFHIDTSNNSAMIVTTEDIAASLEWGCNGQITMNAYGAQIGDGKSNTTDIIQNCSSPFSAALACENYLGSEYADWYLPSEGELYECFQRLHSKDLGNFSLDYYWTSTRVDANTAQHILFIDGSVSFSTLSNLHSVRAVRNI
jgi:hypothetical protein